MRRLLASASVLALHLAAVVQAQAGAHASAPRPHVGHHAHLHHARHHRHHPRHLLHKPIAHHHGHAHHAKPPGAGSDFGTGHAPDPRRKKASIYTPSYCSNLANGLPWTNGRGLISGANVQAQFLCRDAVFNGMGTWDLNGNYTPSVAASASNVTISLPASPSVATVLGYVAYVDAYKAPTDPDDTLGIQRALTAAGINGHVVFQCHQYNVSATLQAFYNQNIEGCGPNNTIIQRTTDYGDTLDIGGISGTTITPSFAFTVQGIWFRQWPIGYGSPQTALTNPVHGGAHLHFWEAQGYTIRDCWFSRMTYGILAEGGTIGNIERNNIIGYYDPQNTGAQESIAGIYLRVNGAGTNPTSVYMRHNNLTGIGYPNRSITYTSGDPKTVVANGTQPVGPLYLILADGCEDCEVDAGYIGGAAADNIHMAQQPNGALLDLRIHDVHFDSAGQNDIHFPNVTGQGRGLTVHNNIFNAEGTTPHAVNIEPSQDATPQPSMTDVSITGNVSFTYAASPILLRGAKYVTIGGNTLSSYNYVGASTGGDATYTSGILAFGISQYVTIDGNTLCGQGGATFYGAVDQTTPVVTNGTSASTVTFGTNGNAGCTTGIHN